MNTNSQIEPTIARRERFHIMGFLTRITPGAESRERFASIWRVFETHRGTIAPLSTNGCYYGASFPKAEGDSFEYVAGMPVMPEGAAVPDGLVAREVPSATYAIFACPVPAIGATNQYIFGQWRATSGLDVDTTAPAFEQYPPAADTASPVLIHIPIRENQTR